VACARCSARASVAGRGGGRCLSCRSGRRPIREPSSGGSARPCRFGARPVGPGGPVLDAAAGEQLCERAVLRVDPRVVGEDPADRDALALVEGQGIRDERDDGRGALVVMDLRKAEPAASSSAADRRRPRSTSDPSRCGGEPRRRAPRPPGSSDAASDAAGSTHPKPTPPTAARDRSPAALCPTTGARSPARPSSTDQPDQLAAPSRSELGVSVNADPGPPWA